MRRLLILLSILYPILFTAMGYEPASRFFKRINRPEGLSNSAALCVFQDSTGLMWFGTYDGLNCYDGRSMETFHSDFSVARTLSNNIVHSIQQADSNCLWITNHLGTNRFSLTSRQVVANYEFPGYHSMHSNRNGNTWLVGLDRLCYYNTHHAQFIEIDKPGIALGDPNTRAFVTDDGNLWLFPAHARDLYRFSLNAFGTDSLSVKLKTTHSPFHSKPIEYISYQNGIFCFVDAEQDLYIYDISGKSKIYTRNIGRLLREYGDVHRMIPFGEDIIIGFKRRGLIRLSASQKYEESVIDPNICVFDIYKDPNQEILWIGSDGQGVIMYAKESSFATHLKLKSFSPNLTRQVRSLLTDSEGGLWCGTKGDGIIYLPHFRDNPNAHQAKAYTLDGVKEIDTYTKQAVDFQVFTLKQSHFRNGFWIGSGDTGLYFYSFDKRQMLPVNPPDADRSVHIHSVYEQNDSVLWLASSENGIRKVWLERTPDHLRIKKQQTIRIIHNKHDIVTYSSMIAQGDSILWIGSRERGLVRLNMATDRYTVWSLKKQLGKAVDDILCLYRYHDGRIFIGTTAGLVEFREKSGKPQLHYTGREQGLPNDMIHGILEDENGFLWLSSNKGVIKYNPETRLSHAYYYSHNMGSGEFSDDAYYRCPYSGQLLFGGVDGLIYMDGKRSTSSGYYPPIVLRQLFIGQQKANLAHYYSEKECTLRIPLSGNSFALTFAVPDYLASSEIEYAYCLEGHDDDWSAFGHSNQVVYSNIAAGKYLLKVRYKKDVSESEYKTLTIPIHIITPWHRSPIARALLLLLLLAATGYLICHHRNRGKPLPPAETSTDREIPLRQQALQREWLSSLITTDPSLPQPDSLEAFGSFMQQIRCVTPEQADFVREFIRRIEQNLTQEELGSTFIAQEMALSPRQFYRRFKEVSEVPPGDLIRTYRIEKAAYLLKHTDASIQEVIAKVGIASRAYFYKEFARKFGMTPKDYRTQSK